MKNVERSGELYAAAKKCLPGGVSSPVRAFKAVGGSPLFMARGAGSKIYDADGNAYLDYVCSWGPLVLGHGYPSVVAALKKAVDNGTSFGASTEPELTLAEMIAETMPSMEMLRFVNSGTEATMSALRLARAFTGRDKIVKFAGCYHGHADGLLVKAGSGLATLGIPDSPGVPAGYAENTLVAPYNDIEAVKQLFTQYPGQIAAVIVEPVAANMGVVLPREGFLEVLRSITWEHGALLIFDEVLVGFRVARGGAQSIHNVKPDLTCLGKIIGGGLPVGAYGGRRDVMEMIAPAGPVYQAGTLSGNPLAMTAGIETLKVLARPGVYEQLEARGAALEQGIKEIAPNGVSVARIGSLLTVFFTDGPVMSYDDASACDTGRFAAFFRSLLEHGIYWPPSQFEAAFISLAHSDDDIAQTVAAIGAALKSS